MDNECFNVFSELIDMISQKKKISNWPSYVPINVVVHQQFNTGYC